MESFKKTICWIRRDLRLSDHHALSQATAQSDEVALVFVFDTTILSHLKDKRDRRVTLIVEALLALDEKLLKSGSRLVVLKGDPVAEIPKIVKTLGADAVFTNEDYEPSAKRRDQEVSAQLKKLGVPLFSLKDQVIFAGSEIVKKDGSPYRVFTPYKNAWLKTLAPENSAELKPNLKKLMLRSRLRGIGHPLSYKTAGFQKFEPTDSFDEVSALKTFKSFEGSIDDYEKTRDFPALSHGTSHLSPHLRFGTISIRELVRGARSKNSSGRKVWLSELIWRDFYHMILDQFPHVEKMAFLEKYQGLTWPGKEKHFEAWCEGKTGYPLVDAAMRQFNETGWMHNRLRMVVASFLVKDLLIDWRKGEKYFADGLIDFDLASNNGGWQWCASTGCDAQPYFRIFNPVSQSLKFDPEGEFIRHWVPELKNVKGKEIHFPKNPVKDYPAPIIDHSEQRDLALVLYKRATRTL